MAAKPITVTARDQETGEEGRAEVPAGQYLLLPVEPLYLAGVVTYTNGTVVLTLKRRK